MYLLLLIAEYKIRRESNIDTLINCSARHVAFCFHHDTSQQNMFRQPCKNMKKFKLVSIEGVNPSMLRLLRFSSPVRFSSSCLPLLADNKGTVTSSSSPAACHIEQHDGKKSYLWIIRLSESFLERSRSVEIINNYF